MALIRNPMKAARVLPVGRNMVEIPAGEAVEIDDAEWVKLKARKTVMHDMKYGWLVEEDAPKPAKAEKPTAKSADKKD